jgi:endonuclease YncB( thermonuclease family)
MGPVYAQEVLCKVVGVTDGDTLTCLSEDHKEIKIRLAQIDAPEKSQAFGEKSKLALSNAVFGERVNLIIETTDKYGRKVATVFKDRTDINLLMVKTGMAWVYKEYAHDPAYGASERVAQSLKLGLWADANPVEPSKWRHKSKNNFALSEQTKGTTLVLKPQFQCGVKSKCAEMASCEEAKFNFQTCGLYKLDRDKDGIPCESLCS